MIPLFKPFMPDTPLIDEILHSGKLAYGEYTKKFESLLRDYFDTEYLLVTNSYQIAIQIACSALGLKYGDEVIASPMGCLASTQPVQSSGYLVKWADVDPHIGTLDPISVRRSISQKTKAIVHNHFCGYPGHIDEINSIGKEYGIPVIDDGIECFGSEYKGKKIGGCGTDVTVFSLTAVRIPNCIDGGIIIFQDKEQYERAVLLRDCGIDRNLFRDDLGEINAECDITLKGYSATMSNVNGYIGCKQMENISSIFSKQRLQAKNWKNLLKNTEICFLNTDDSNPNYWVFGTLVKDKRNSIIKWRNKGYYASGVHMRNDVYSVFGSQNVELPGVDEFFNHFVALPCGWWMN